MACRIASQLAGGTKSNSQQGAFRARTPTALVPGSMDQRLNRRSSPNIKRPHTLGRVDLVAGNCEQIDTQGIDAGRNLTHGLRGICMQQNTVIACDAAYLLDRLNRPNLVVRVHDADEDGL